MTVRFSLIHGGVCLNSKLSGNVINRGVQEYDHIVKGVLGFRSAQNMLFAVYSKSLFWIDLFLHSAYPHLICCICVCFCVSRATRRYKPRRAQTLSVLFTVTSAVLRRVSGIQ